ncbi:MAG: hypothetical protein P8J87_02065, partial [Verrucomicrobiales bacterium]|nr:hypothetical protein [Verrucomicrobiales bacterium]
NGHEMADMGVKRAPEAIPSWYDVRPGSEFITGLFDGDLAVDHLLIYTTKATWNPVLPKENDGAVGVDSQLGPRATGGAERTKEFVLSHVGVLEEAAVVDEVEAFLAE